MHLDAHITREGARFSVRHDGERIEPWEATDDGDCFESGRGRVPTLMRFLMDDVTFNDVDNEVILEKRAKHYVR